MYYVVLNVKVIYKFLLSNNIIIKKLGQIINDIYLGSSTHSKVVFREVLHPIKLE